MQGLYDTEILGRMGLCTGVPCCTLMQAMNTDVVMQQAAA